LMEQPDKSAPVLVLGGGPAGLAAGLEMARLGKRVIVLEKENIVGGVSSSLHWNRFILEYGPHTYHLKHDRIDEMIQEVYGGELIVKKRITRLLLRGQLFDYPLKFWQLLRGLNPFFSLRMVLDFIFTSIRFKIFPRADDCFRTWGIKRFGFTLYNLCFGQYTERLWGMSADKLSVRLASSKLHKLNLKDILVKLLGRRGQEQATYWEDFLYPEEGMGIIYEKMADEIVKAGSEVWLESQPVDPESYQAALSLRSRSLIVVNLVVRMPMVSDAHWIYLLDPSYHFNRFCEQKNLLAERVPPLETMLTFEICCAPDDEFWNLPDEELVELALADIANIERIDGSRVADSLVRRVRDAYPIYDLEFEDNIAVLFDGLAEISNLYTTGRQGLFLNTDMHDTMELGIKAAQAVRDGISARDWNTLINPWDDSKAPPPPHLSSEGS